MIKGSNEIGPVIKYKSLSFAQGVKSRISRAESWVAWEGHLAAEPRSPDPFLEMTQMVVSRRYNIVANKPTPA